MTTDTRPLEIKADTGITEAFGEFMRTFEVFKDANKHQIAEAVEQTFKVTVRRVNTMTIRGKNKKSRTGRPTIGSDYKKAIVTLKAGDKIELV